MLSEVSSDAVGGIYHALKIVFRPSSTKSGRPYGFMSASSSSCRTPPLPDPPADLGGVIPEGGLALHCYITYQKGALGLYAESACTCGVTCMKGPAQKKIPKTADDSRKFLGSPIISCLLTGLQRRMGPQEI